MLLADARPFPNASRHALDTADAPHPGRCPLHAAGELGCGEPPWNPLHRHPEAAGQSRYLAPEDGELVPILGTAPATAQERAIHARFQSKVQEPGFPCVAARSVFNRGTYRFGAYGRLGSSGAALALCHDLYEFAHEWPVGQPAFASLIAAFPAPVVADESAFEHLLWQQLQLMHDIDRQFFGWDRAVSRDPAHPQFSFSIGARAFFVVGLNPCASRHARRTETSLLVFNLHDQFEALRASGKFEPMQQAIRQRDLAYQGSLNPMLDDFGRQSETRQYSGRAVPHDWRCPFQFRHPAAPTGEP
jgi:FPC/CPF motif-containing protein YcgG